MTDTPPSPSQPSEPSTEQQIVTVQKLLDATERTAASWPTAREWHEPGGIGFERITSLRATIATLRAYEAQSRELAEARKEIERLTQKIARDEEVWGELHGAKVCVDKEMEAMTEMPPMVPSAEDRNQAEAIVEAFHNDDLEGSLVDEIAECLVIWKRTGFTAGVQAERQATDRDQINFDEGRRFERAAIIAMLLEGKAGTPVYRHVSNRIAREVTDIQVRDVMRALADHLESQTK